MEIRFLILIAGLLIVAYFSFRSGGEQALLDDKISKFVKSRPGVKAFMCHTVEDLGQVLIQLWGIPIGGSIRPGMSVTLPQGREYEIFEVYAADDTPDKPDAEITPEMSSTTIVIKAKKDLIKEISIKLKRDKLLALLISDTQFKSDHQQL